MASIKTWHRRLTKVVKLLPSDLEPYGSGPDSERGADCSCGCKWFVGLEGMLGADWGICANSGSPRAGLLTFEHMGCPQFRGGDYYEPDRDDRILERFRREP